jgi:hypothetical protein
MIATRLITQASGGLPAFIEMLPKGDDFAKTA